MKYGKTTRIMILFLAIILIFSLCACGKNPDGGGGASDGDPEGLMPSLPFAVFDIDSDGYRAESVCLEITYGNYHNMISEWDDISITENDALRIETMSSRVYLVASSGELWVQNTEKRDELNACINSFLEPGYCAEHGLYVIKVIDTAEFIAGEYGYEIGRDGSLYAIIEHTEEITLPEELFSEAEGTIKIGLSAIKEKQVYAKKYDEDRTMYLEAIESPINGLTNSSMAEESIDYVCNGAVLKLEHRIWYKPIREDDRIYFRSPA